MITIEYVYNLYNKFNVDGKLTQSQWYKITTELLGYCCHPSPSNKTSNVQPCYINNILKNYTYIIPNVLVLEFDMFHINALRDGEFFIDPSYKTIINDLLDIRKMLKSINVDNEYFSIADKLIFFIKTYINQTYGMLMGGSSIIDKCKFQDAFNKSNTIIEQVTQYIVNSGYDIFYIDTNKIHCSDAIIRDDNIYNTILSMIGDYHKLNTYIINNVIYFGKKRYIESNNIKSHGIKNYIHMETAHSSHVSDLNNFWLEFKHIRNMNCNFGGKV